MANLTITVDDEVLQQARVRAAEQRTSVNAVLREELFRFAGVGRSGSAIDPFLEFARTNSGSSGPGGRNWTREELYEERLARYDK